MKRIAFIGEEYNHFDNKHVSGREARSESILVSLRKYNPSVEVNVADRSILSYGRGAASENWRRTVPLLEQADAIVIVLTSTINRTFIRSIYAERYAAKSIGIVIGGMLADSLAAQRTLRWKLLPFNTLMVQTDSMRRQLEELGFPNIRVLQNYRVYEPGLLRNIMPRKKLRRCVVYSRLVPEKGVKTAIEAVRLFNGKRSEPVTLDIYGPLPPYHSEESEWLRLISEQEHIQYKGVLDFRTAIQTLNGYDCLLFPTYFIGEGFPGTIFEGFAAGLPIIATDWLFNRELICDGENGFLVPIRNPAAIAEKLALLAENDELVYKMSLQSLASFDKYREERAVPPLYEALDAILKKSNYDA